ncbi:hypothetical protein EJ08DRAFT_283996 [Tothia fuscella]|uniref:Uncharacterized protein n=1 Tax=Tothia fuscella TaxID=1048955 RepID=A0A9P4NZZ7_9PEZI|nr:hypothetical protein EJ08DRAFT_283996 [Tothia fuscella]
MDNKYNGEYKSQTMETVSSNQQHQPPTKKSKMKEHFRRFWWLHLISFIIGTILVTLLLIFVGMPNIAQNGINGAELFLESQVVTNPTPQSVQVQMVTISKSKSPFHPWLDGFRAALYLEDSGTGDKIKPFGYIDVPRTKADATARIVVQQKLDIVDQEQFVEYNKRVTLSETYRVGIRGRPGLKEGGFPKTNVNFNKIITSKGLNGLKGFEVRNITISLAPDKDGTNMRGQVFIPNPSPMTLQLGLVTQDVFVGDIKIATATIPDLILRPGDNLVPMSSVSDQAKVISLISTKYPDGKLPVTIIGNSTIFAGQHLPYFESALQANRMQTTLTLGPALKAIGLDVTKLGGSGGASTNSSSTSASSPSPLTSAAPVVSSIIPPKTGPTPASVRA